MGNEPRKDRDDEWDAGTAEVREPRGNSPWEQTSNPYTVEGEIEGVGNLAYGVRHSGGWKRAVGLFMVATMLAPMVIGFVFWVWQFITRSGM